MRPEIVAAVLMCAAACGSSSVVADAHPLADGGPGADAGGVAGNVLEHHGGPSRAGVYVVPALTRAAAAGLRKDTSFSAAVMGPTHAQPLYFAGAGGHDAVIVATERNQVSALDAATGAPVWQTVLAPPVPRSSLPCGNIDPLGITGTPVIDPASRTIFLDAMTLDGGPRHKIYALDVDSGAVRSGWPVDLDAAVSGFQSRIQNQRGGLTIMGGRVYVPYGGHFGDCGDYHGWVVGVDVADPTRVGSWATRARGGGAWAPSGIASDGTNLYIATGNTFGAQTWSDGEAIIRLQAGPTFRQEATDYFAPANWMSLDSGDIDIGGTGPVLFDAGGARLTIALGKDARAYLLDRTNLGGVGGALVVKVVSRGAIIQAAAAYTTPAATYVTFAATGSGCPSGQSGDLVALKIGTSPPAIDVAWCAKKSGRGSPMVTTVDGTNESIVWAVAAEGDGHLHGFDGDSGAALYTGSDDLGAVARFQTPIVAGGRIFVAANDAVHAFALP
jgi:putative pyrroloquinoline-quinone binding quinoprotein